MLAARLDLAMADRALHQAELARRMLTDRATVCKMLQGRDGYVSTWLLAVDAAGYEVVLLPKQQ